MTGLPGPLLPDLDPARPLPTPWEDYEAWVSAEWEKLLNSSPAEDAVQTFLEQHPSLVPGAYGDVGPGGNHGPHLQGLWRQPPLKGAGRSFVPDFMWITTSTTMVTPICIEIEKPDRPWFDKNGDPRKGLVHAREQLADWEAWFSVPENQAIFRREYGLDRYRDYSLRPQFLLVYGRSGEFDTVTSPHKDPAALRYKRDRTFPAGMEARSFDGLAPNPKCRDVVTLTQTVHGPALHAVPPSFTAGPDLTSLAGVVRGCDAVQDTPLWSQARKDYVKARWTYWRGMYDSSTGTRLRTTRRGE